MSISLHCLYTHIVLSLILLKFILNLLLDFNQYPIYYIMSNNRTLYQIASEIRKDWKNVNFAAKPYLDAMAQLESVSQNYGWDSGKSIVLYFLGNANAWRGEKAKEIKAELKAMCK